MQRLLTYRALNLILVFFSIVGIAFAVFYLQMYKALEPCPLCVFQRAGLIVMGIFAFIAAVFNPKKIVTQIILWLGSIAGIAWSAGVAARHVWIQNLPPELVPACGPGLDYWLEVLPMKQVINEVLSGSGECAEISWTFLGLSIPEQGLIFFSALILVNLMVFWRIIKGHRA